MWATYSLNTLVELASDTFCVGLKARSKSTKMWRLFSFVVTCVVVQQCCGQTSCPGNAQQRIIECGTLLQTFAQAQTTVEVMRQCGNGRRGVKCMRNVIEECQGVEGTPIAEMVANFNDVERTINLVCPPADASESAPVPTPVRATTPPTESVTVPNRVNTCSNKDKRKLQKCARRLQRYAAEDPVRCSKVKRVLQCMSQQMEKCTSIIKPRLFARVNQLRRILSESCVETNIVVDETEELEKLEEAPNDNAVPEEPSCPSDYLGIVQRCVGELNQEMGNIIGHTGVSADQCRALYDNLDCINNIFSACSNMPGVSDMSAGFDVDQIRSYIGPYCPNEIPETVTEPAPEVTVSSCPAGHTQKLEDCMRPMQGIRAGHYQNIEEMCSIMNTGFDCIQDIIDRCPDKPDVEAVTSMMNLDNMRAMVQAQCTGGPMPTPSPGGKPSSNCPGDYGGKMTACVEPMQNIDTATPQNLAQACRAAQEGFNCLGDIMTNCSGEPEVQAITSMLNIDEIGNMVKTQCSKITPNGCGVSDPAEELKRCNGFLTSFQPNSDSLESECRTLFEGFDCFRDLIRKCPDDPAVTAFTSTIDIESARNRMSVYCPSRK